MAQKIITIGIGGATCGGKSTLAKLVCQLFGDRAQKLNQDDFYFPDEYPGHVYVPEVKHINWEVESAFDNAKLIRVVKERIQSSEDKAAVVGNVSNLIQALDESRDNPLLVDGEKLSAQWQKLFERSVIPSSVLIVEGIHVLTCKELSQLCDLKFFVTLDHKTCWERRQLRSYDPPDPPGYFDKIVWPSYCKQLEILMKSAPEGLHFLDGRDGLSDNLRLVLKLILES